MLIMSHRPKSIKRSTSKLSLSRLYLIDWVSGKVRNKFVFIISLKPLIELCVSRNLVSKLDDGSGYINVARGSKPNEVRMKS